MSYGVARETGLDGAREVARSLNEIAKAINRLAAAHEKANTQNRYVPSRAGR